MHFKYCRKARGENGLAHFPCFNILANSLLSGLFDAMLHCLLDIDMKTTVKVSTLKASIHCLPSKTDGRHYLHGVNFAFKHGVVSRLEISTTDGVCLSSFSENLDYLENPQTADFAFVIPINAIKLALKGVGKKSVLILESLSDGRYLLGDTIFSPIDGVFPDYRRVIPRNNTPKSDAPLQFDPCLLVKAHDALSDYYGNIKANFTLDHLHSVGVMHFGKNDAVIVIMPFRENDYSYQGLYTVTPLNVAY